MAEPISYPPILVRDLDLCLDESTPRYWFGGDPFTTHFFNAISTTFPDGERFFIRSVRHYSDAIADPPLVAEIAAFAGQEARHSREHDRHVTLLIKDRQMRPSVLMRGFGVLFGRGGFIRVLWTPLMEFWRRDFHPWQIDNTAFLAQRKLEWGFAAASRSET